jgi:glycosyltransferase involved in cell wall biosynthesis
MYIGIAAFGSKVGNGGGVSVYTHQLVQALARHSNQHHYKVLIQESELEHWCNRDWPDSVDLVVIPPKDLTARALQQVERTIKRHVPSYRPKSYIARQLDALGLDLLHYPKTIIKPSDVDTLCVLTFFDLQHRYYPQFFTEEQLKRRAESYPDSVEKAEKVIIASKFTGMTLTENYQVPSGKMIYVPVGISEEFYPRGADEIGDIRSKYDLPDEFLFYPANPWPHKNHARLLSALRIYKNVYHYCLFLVVSGKLKHENRSAEEFAIAAGVADQVIDLGFVPASDLPSLYSAATALVFPSLFEGFGIPLLEAMACGCPVVAADATSIPEVVGEAAILFDPFDPGDMASKIHQVITDKSLRQDLAERGIDRARQFSWANVIEDLENVYQSMLG